VGLLTAEDVNEAYRLLSTTPALGERSQRAARTPAGVATEERQPAVVS
jgi:hypothetical protein